MILDLKNIVYEPLSKKAKNMTDFRNYISFEDRKFQVMSKNEERAKIEQHKKQILFDKISRREKISMSELLTPNKKQKRNQSNELMPNDDQKSKNHSINKSGIVNEDTQTSRIGKQIFLDNDDQQQNKVFVRQSYNLRLIGNRSSLAAKKINDGLFSPQNQDYDDPYKDELMELLGKSKNDQGFDYHKFRMLYKTKYVKSEIDREMSENKKKKEQKQMELDKIERMLKMNEKTMRKNQLIQLQITSQNQSNETLDTIDVIGDQTSKSFQASPNFRKLNQNDQNQSQQQDQVSKLTNKANPNSRPGKNNTPLQDQQLQKTKNFIFDSTSREYQHKIQNLGKCSPPLGKYNPRFELLMQSNVTHKIRESKDNDLFTPKVQKESILNCSKLSKQISEIQNQLNNYNNSHIGHIHKRSSDLSAQLPSHSDIPNQSFINNQNTQSQMSNPFGKSSNHKSKHEVNQSFDKANPIIQKQQKIEQLWGQKARLLSPLSNYQVIDDSKNNQNIQFGSFTQKAYGVDFSRQAKKENLVHKSSRSPHDQRFENINKFPSILSQNTKQAVNIDLQKYVSRKGFIEGSGINKDKLLNHTHIDINYSQIEKRTNGMSFGMSFEKNKILQQNSQREEQEEESQGKSFHEDFKPKNKFLKRIQPGQATHFFILDD
eukprot:403348698